MLFTPRCTNILRLATQTTPLLLWIDDLHWADNASLDLISFLADHADDLRMLLICTYRSTDIVQPVLGQLHPLRRLVDKLKRYDQCQEITIAGFNLVDIQVFMTTASYHLPTIFIERLWRQSGGNPLFIQEYLRLMHEYRLMKREQGKYILARPEVEIEIPDKVQVVIEQRLSLLADDLRRTLAYASIQGERFAAQILARLLATTELDVLEKLNLLERMHQLIYELEQQQLIYKVETEYQFVHALTQQALYNSLSDGQRRQLHLTVAELLEQIYNRDAIHYAGDLAVHFERGGSLARAIPYYLQAGRNALVTLALDDAQIQAEKARQLIGQLASGEQIVSWQSEALLQLIEIFYWKAQYEVAYRISIEGEAVCQAVSRSEQQAAFLYWRSHLSPMLRQGNPVELVQQALKLLGPTPRNRKLQGQLYVRLGAFYARLPLAEVEEALRQGLAIAEVGPFPDVKVQALLNKGWLTMNRIDQPDEALKYGQEALNIAINHKMLYEQIISHRQIAYISRRLKRGEEVIQHNMQAIALAQKSGLLQALHVSLYSYSLSLKQIRDDWQAALTAIHEAIAIAEQHHFLCDVDVISAWYDLTLGLGQWLEAERAKQSYQQVVGFKYSPGDLGNSYRREGDFAFAHGRFIEAVQTYNQAIAAYDEEKANERMIRALQPFLGFALIEIGELQQAIHHLNEAHVYWQNRKTNASYARTLQGLARLNLSQGVLVEAASHLHQALSAIEGNNEGGFLPVWPCVSMDLGQVLLAMGKLDEAIHHAQFSYERFKEMGHHMLGEAAFVVGQILATIGKQDEALIYLREAYTNWQSLELTHHIPAWERVVREIGGDPSEPDARKKNKNSTPLQGA